jgi:hypothetical protein
MFIRPQNLQGFWLRKYGVAESREEHRFCQYSKISLSLFFEICTKEDSSPESAMPEILALKTYPEYSKPTPKFLFLSFFQKKINTF